MIKKVINSQRPFCVVQTSTILGDDWFIIMFRSDTKGLYGFHESKSHKLLEEYDLNEDEISYFRSIRNKFQKSSPSKEMNVFNYQGANFKAVHDSRVMDIEELKKKVSNYMTA